MSDFVLSAPIGANRKKKILGRGQGSGRGTTAGKGNKGQKSRSGGKTYIGFEGGQMPLYRRLAHKGFKNYPFKVTYQVINLDAIEAAFNAGETVNPESLQAKRLAKGNLPVKVLAKGDISKALKFETVKLSKTAIEKIQKSGGEVKADVPAEKNDKAQG
jgi:large subunit ribosomal protein L15